MPLSLRHRLLAASLSLGLATALAASAAAETLADAIAEAYENNPNLQAQRANQRVTDETYVQARTGWRPTLNLSASGSYEELRTPTRAFTQFGQREIARGNSGALQMTFNQPIWTGGRTAAAVTAANADVLQGRENLRRVESQVVQLVIQAYADVLRDQASVGIRQENVKVLGAQLEESQARFDVGEITRTDVALSQARLAAAQALLQSSVAQLAISKASYANLVGHNPGDLAPEPSLAYLMPGNVDDAFTIAEQNSPLLRAQLFAEQASRARIAGARAERMPSVNFQATGIYKNGPIDPFDRGLYSRDATAAVGVSVPLFTGGLTTSRIRQSIERNNADRITIETQRRSVLQTISQSWNTLLAARANIVSTDEQVRAAKIAAEGTHQEEQVGLRSTIDTLNAEQELRAAQLSQVTAIHDEYTAAAAVLAAMGRLEARNLIPREPQYDPRTNFRKLRITWGWVPWEEPIAVVDGALAYPTIPRSHELTQEPPIGPGLPTAPQAAPAAAAPTPVAPPQTAPAQPAKPKPAGATRKPRGLY